MLGAIRKRFSRTKPPAADTSPCSDAISASSSPPSSSGQVSYSDQAQLDQASRIVGTLMRLSSRASTGPSPRPASDCESPVMAPLCAVTSAPLDVKVRPLSEAISLSSPSSESSALRRSSSMSTLSTSMEHQMWPHDLQMHGYGASPETQSRVLAEFRQQQKRRSMINRDMIVQVPAGEVSASLSL